MKKIISPNNDFIKHLIKLRQNKKYREEKSLCLVIGNKIVKELSKKNILRSIITTDPENSLNAENTYLVTEEILKKITALPAPEELLAEISLPEKKELSKEKFLIVLDKIKDPGNLGTLIRTAHGLFWDGVIITPESVDPFNDKALRAAKGSTFSIPLFYKTPKEIQSLINKKKYFPYLADMRGKNLSSLNFSLPLILILSSESHGIDQWTNSIKDRVSIPISKELDSLNVAISGGILLYEISRRIKENG